MGSESGPGKAVKTFNMLKMAPMTLDTEMSYVQNQWN